MVASSKNRSCSRTTSRSLKSTWLASAIFRTTQSRYYADKKDPHTTFEAKANGPRLRFGLQLIIFLAGVIVTIRRHLDRLINVRLRIVDDELTNAHLAVTGFSYAADNQLAREGHNRRTGRCARSELPVMVGLALNVDLDSSSSAGQWIHADAPTSFCAGCLVFFWWTLADGI